MNSFLIRWLLNALPLWLATYIFADFKFAGLGSLIVAALLFGLVNAVIRPIILLLTLPLTIVTLGLFILVINALMLMFVAAVVPGFVLGGFWTAFWAAIFIAIVSFITNRLIGRS
ncbi:MAG: phage holin family protein [Betaproteobacteria bacterium]